MEIRIWKPGRKLVRSCKSGSGGQGPTLMFLTRESTRKTGFKRLARSWKSRSEVQRSKIDVVTQRVIGKRLVSRGWPDHVNLDLETRVRKIDLFY